VQWGRVPVEPRLILAGNCVLGSAYVILAGKYPLSLFFPAEKISILES